MTAIRFTGPVHFIRLPSGRSYGGIKEGEVLDVPPEDAEFFVSRNLATHAQGVRVEQVRGEEEEPEVGEEERPAWEMPVKVGTGLTWLSVSLWPPRPDAKEKWKRRARISVRRLRMNGDRVEVRQSLHLTPTEAAALGGLILQAGFEGKKLDREAKD